MVDLQIFVDPSEYFVILSPAPRKCLKLYLPMDALIKILYAFKTSHSFSVACACDPLLCERPNNVW